MDVNHRSTRGCFLFLYESVPRGVALTLKCVARARQRGRAATLLTCYQQPDTDTLLPRPPDAGQVVGKTAPQTAPPLIEAQSTAGAIANGASR